MEFQQFQISACSRGSLSLGKRLIPNAGLPITTASASVHKCSRAELIAKFQITSRPEKGSQNPQKQSAPKQYRAESTHFLETCASSFCVCVYVCVTRHIIPKDVVDRGHSLGPRNTPKIKSASSDCSTSNKVHLTLMAEF